MNKLFQKYWKEILLAAFIIASFLILRTIYLDRLPIFTDEAIYVRWAQIAKNDASWRFISLTDGKQPMFTWGSMIMMRFVEDPLIAARFTSVVAGLFTLAGVWVLTYELFRSRRPAFIAAILYACYPFAQVYDRMALQDSMVAAFTVWALYLSVRLVRSQRLDIAYTLGAVVGGGMLTKTNANFSLYLLPFTLILIGYKRNFRKKILKWIVLALFTAIVAQVIYNTLRLSPFFHIVAQKNAIFVYPISEWLEHPFTFFFGNLKGLTSWFMTYFSTYTILILASIFAFRKFPKEKLLLIIYFLAPFIALALFGKVIFPRFIFFMTVPLICFAAQGAVETSDFLSKKMRGSRKMALQLVMVALVILYPLYVSFTFANSPQDSRIAKADKEQYVSSWPSGVGVEEATEFFRKEAKDKKIFVATQGTFGLMPYSLEINLVNEPNVEIKGYWPTDEQMPREISGKASKVPSYVVFYQPCHFCAAIGKAPKSWPVAEVISLKREDGSFFTVYKVGSNDTL